MATLTYCGNVDPTDGTAALQVASGVVPLGQPGVFTALEQFQLQSKYFLVDPTKVGVTVVNGPPTVETITVYDWPGDNFYLTFGGQASYAVPTLTSAADLAQALNLLSSIGVNDVQTISITGTPTGGSFTLTFGGQTTGPIPFNATAAQVQAALQALSSIGGLPNPAGYSGLDVSCSGGPLPGTPVVVTFVGAAGGKPQTPMTHTDSFTGGASPAAAVAHTTTGATNCTATGPIGGPYVVTFTGTLAGGVQAALGIFGSNLSVTADLSKFSYPYKRS